MPAVSKSQQRLMGMVHAYKSGQLDLKDLSPSLAKKIKSISDGAKRKTGDKRTKTKGISDRDAKHFASTKHKGLPEKVEESKEFDRLETIELICNASEFNRIDLRKMSDDELKDLYDDLEIDDLIKQSDPYKGLDNDNIKVISQEKLITKFDNFLNEAKKPKGQKLKFEDWWKKSFEKVSDYWVEKKEIKQGYQTGDLTHYKERKMRSKYNKYLKRKKK
jgi:hypothetical protein